MAWATLLGADTDRIRMSLDGTALDIDRVALAAAWNGDYLAIWSAPDGLEKAFAAGDTAATDWVSRRLRADGRDTADPAAALRAFQARHGLRSDGILGPETLFVLSGDEPGPHLSAPVE